MRNNVIIFANKKGAAPLNIFPTLIPVIIEQTFKQFPTGGVQAPTAKPITKITPKSIGEIAMFMILGRKTGVNNSIAGLTSIKVPVIKIIKTNRNNILLGWSPSPWIISANLSGTLSNASTHMKIFENAIIIIIFALVREEVFKALNILPGVKVFRIRDPRIKA